MNLVAGLIVLGCIRLTWNYARKGGYAPGGEDYRWAVLRSRMPPWAFQVFNVFFIAGYQHLLVFLTTLPIWQVWAHHKPLGAVDIALAAVFLLFLAGETLADQQQWNYHQWKKVRVAAREPVGNGFLETGLWAYSRHPNFFCEQAIWWVVYAFAVAAGAGWWNVTLVGPVLLTLLFHGSAKVLPPGFKNLGSRRLPANQFAQSLQSSADINQTIIPPLSGSAAVPISANSQVGGMSVLSYRLPARASW